MKQFFIGLLAALIWMLNGALLIGCSHFQARDLRDIRITTVGCEELELEVKLEKGEESKEVNRP